MYSQNNANWSDWTMLEEGSSLNQLHMASDGKGTLFVAGIDEKETLFVRQCLLGSPKFLDGIQWSGTGKCKTVRAIKTASAPNTPLVWIAQNAAGQLYRRFDGDDSGHWVTLGNHAFTDAWDVLNVDGSTLLLYGLRVDGTPMIANTTYAQPHTQDALNWLEKPVEKIEVELQQDGWSISGENVVHTMQATELSAHINIYGELCMSAVVPSKYPGTWYYAEERTVDRSKTWQQLPTFGHASQMTRNRNGAVMQFVKTKQNGISYMSTLNPAAGWNKELHSLGGDFEQWRVFTDTLGVITLVGLDKWNQLQICKEDDSQKGFSNWEPLLDSDVKIKSFAIGINGDAKLQLVVADSNGNLLTVSERVLNCSAVNEQQSPPDAITPSANQITFEASEPHPDADLIAPYREHIGSWLRSLGDKIGEDGYKKLLDAKSLEELIDAHLSLNDFDPGNVLDYMSPEHYALLVNKTHAILADKYIDESECEAYIDSFITTMSELMDSVHKLSKHLGIPLPLCPEHFKRHTLQMLKEIPDAIIKKLSSHLDYLNLDVVHQTIGQITSATASEHSEQTTKNTAQCAGLLRVTSGALKLVYNSIPLTVGLGLNIAITASAQCSNTLQGSNSIGSAKGSGSTLPLSGNGANIGAGIGNGTLFKLDAVWLGLVPAVLAPVGVLCDIAADMLEAEITISKDRA